MGRAVVAALIAAVVAMAALTWIVLALLHFPTLERSSSISLTSLIALLQLEFATIAGAGVVGGFVASYRKQLLDEAKERRDELQEQRKLIAERIARLDARFNAASAQLGDVSPTVRQAGVQAMASLADDWVENRQTCVNVLCAYLRNPYEPDPEETAPAAERLAFRALREVRQAVVPAIAAHLQKAAAVSWQGLDFDFSGAVFEGGDFSGAVFAGGTVSFRSASFPAGRVGFGRAEFSGGQVNFSGTVFSGAEVGFSGAGFSGGQVGFSGAGFSGGEVGFSGAGFSGGQVGFRFAEFSGGQVSFGDATFAGGEVDFDVAVFSGGQVGFLLAAFSGGHVGFRYAKFSHGTVEFGGARFSGGQVSFRFAEFSGSQVAFGGARFSGAEVNFDGAAFSGGQVNFSHPEDWSYPPQFGWSGTPPSGLKLPAQPDASSPGRTSDGADSPQSAES